MAFGGSRFTRRVVRALALVTTLLVLGLSACSTSTSEGGEQEACDLEPQPISSVPQSLETEDGEEPIGTTQEELSSLSCKMSGATGYKSGNSFKIQTVRIDGKAVEWKTANAYIAMAKAAAQDGVQIRVVSGFRTM